MDRRVLNEFKEGYYRLKNLSILGNSGNAILASLKS
jgi:hypothetical protein